MQYPFRGSRLSYLKVAVATLAAALLLSGCPGLFFDTPEGDNPLDPNVGIRLKDVPFDDPDLRQLIYETEQYNDRGFPGPETDSRVVEVINGSVFHWALPGNVDSLGGVEYLTNLQELRLNYVSWDDDQRVSGGTISTLAPLSQLYNLRHIDANNSRVTDLSPLAGMGSLHTIGFQGCAIASLEPLYGNDNLSFISLSGPNTYSDYYYAGAVTDIAEFSGLTGLELDGFDLSDTAVLDTVLGSQNITYIGLTNCSITDMNFISRYPDLTGISLSGNPITALPTTATTFPDLDRMDLSWTDIPAGGWGGLPSVIGAPELIDLSFYATAMATVPSLSGYPKLERISLGEMQALTDISALTGLTTVTDLNIGGDWDGGTVITDFSPIGTMTALTSLELRDEIGFTDADYPYVTGLPNLEEFRVGYASGITVVPDFTGITTLRRLDIQGAVTDLNLTNIQTVETVAIGGNALVTMTGNSAGSSTIQDLSLSYQDQLTDAAPLTSLPSLTSLNLEGCFNLITGIQTLATLTNLTYLNLSGSGALQADVDYLRQELPEAEIIY